MKMSRLTASKLTIGKWYVMYNRGNGRGYLWENAGSHTLFNTATAPNNSATASAKYLVRLQDADNGLYYVQTGFGNYFGKFEQSTNVAVTANPTEAVTVGTINGPAGHFYLESSTTGRILDCNDYSQGDSRATVVGWGTSVPTSTGGNNDWAFYPVELQGEPVGIENLTSDAEASSRFFNLAGQRVSRPSQRGTYIINRRKILVN